MPSVTINGNTYQDFNSAFAAGSSPASGTYYCVEPFGSPPQEGAPIYDDRPIKFAGVLAIGTKRLNFLGRPIHIELITVGASRAAVAANADAIESSVAQLARYSVSLNGISRPGCKLTDCKHGASENVGTQVCMKIVIDLLQMQES